MIKIHKKTSFLSTLIVATLLVSACGSNSEARSNQNNTQSNAQNTAQTNQTPSLSAGTDAHPTISAALQANLNKSGIKAKVIGTSDSGMPNIYLAQIEAMPAIFTDATGTYIIEGEIIKVGGATAINISDEALAVTNKAALEAVDKSEMIIFPAKGATKGVIYAFTDPTCHYCQILHKDRDKLNNLGIEIRYLAWPRGDTIVPISEAIWCSPNRQQALTDAKNGKTPNSQSCDNPVRKHMELGYSLGVSGTPAIFNANGLQLGGYLPPERLADAAIIK